MEPALELNCECKGLVACDLMEGWRVRGDDRRDWREEEVGRVEKSGKQGSKEKGDTGWRRKEITGRREEGCKGMGKEKRKERVGRGLRVLGVGGEMRERNGK